MINLAGSFSNLLGARSIQKERSGISQQLIVSGGITILASMGRLDCDNSEFSLKVTVIKSRPEVFRDSFFKGLPGETRITTRETVLIAPIHELLIKSGVEYVIRLGRVCLPDDNTYDVAVRFEILDHLNRPHAGLVF